ncbi:MAG: hypothetical protein IKT03_04670, partial [Muribaculaceae bacterium]|nr:hypothetical protein [Muribaculaceae bacterium]
KQSSKKPHAARNTRAAKNMRCPLSLSPLSTIHYHPPKLRTHSHLGAKKMLKNELFFQKSLHYYL